MPDDERFEGLFEVAPGQRSPGDVPVVKVPVLKTFRAFAPGQDLLLPPSLDDWLPADHLARFVAELVDEHLDLSRVRSVFTEGRGAPPYDPRLMVRILLYGYTTGVRSSRKLEAACVDVVAFRWLAAGTAPDYRSIARFRKRHLSALGHLFVQALALCQAAGMVKLGRVALDGTKLRANASRRKAMSYARMSEKEKILAAEVSDLLAEAEAIDKGEDAKYGKDRRGDELPEELRRRESRLARIRQAKQALEDEARERAEAEAEAKARDNGEDEDTVAERVAAAAEKAVPRPKAQRNFTDPESKIMKTSDGSFHQCFNAQAVVDAEHQVIVAADLNDCAADVANLIPMTEQTIANTGQTPVEVLADAGYCSEDNLTRASDGDVKLSWPRWDELSWPRGFGVVGLAVVGGGVVEGVEGGVESLLSSAVGFVVGVGGEEADQFVELVGGGGEDGPAGVVGADGEDEPFAVGVEELEFA